MTLDNSIETLIKLKEEGNRYAKNEQWKQAEEKYKQALEIDPEYIDAINNLAGVYAMQGNISDAESLMHETLELLEKKRNESSFKRTLLGDGMEMISWMLDYKSLLFNLINLYIRLNRNDDAEYYVDKLLVVDEDEISALKTKVALLSHKSFLDNSESIELLKRIIEKQPDDDEALANLGSLYVVNADFENALKYLQKAVQINPDNLKALDYLIRAKQSLCDWDSFYDLISSLLSKVKEGDYAIDPFHVLSLPVSAETQKELIEKWARIHIGAKEQNQKSYGNSLNEKIKVGYLSPKFRPHAGAYLIAELFELHDKSKFEIIGYSISPDNDSDIRKRIEQSLDKFVDLNHLNDDEAAELIRNDNVDILVDLTGYADKCRPGILKRKPAPVQVNYLGFPGTMGADFMDYIIVDEIIAPNPDVFTEKPVFMPDCYQINDRKRAKPNPNANRSDYGLPDDAVIFCCFNNTYKITPDFFDVWMRLLNKVEGSLIWFLEFNDIAQSNITEEARARGINPDRLVFSPMMPFEKHISRLKVASMFLDTLPYNAHVTCSDALWAGCPVITCEGETFAGRVASSILQAAGLSELVTKSLEEYEEKALELALNPNKLASVRIKVQETTSAPIFNTPLYVSNLEDAYKQMLE